MGGNRLIENVMFDEERALFGTRGAVIRDCVFRGIGESPLKESGNLDISRCVFEWKYPLWYCKDVKVADTEWHEGARAGVWYTGDIEVDSCRIYAPKNFRRCRNLRISNVSFPRAEETLWACDDVTLRDVEVKGDYFAMNCNRITATGLKIDGNYSFDGCKDVDVRSSTLDSKDAFWNCENVYVKDSVIRGEYIGWNSKNVVFENCEIDSLQGLCYIDNLKLINCNLADTTLAFEYSTVDADITTRVKSIINPSGGRIACRGVDELIMDEHRIDPEKTEIVIKEG